MRLYNVVYLKKKKIYFTSLCKSVKVVPWALFAHMHSIICTFCIEQTNKQQTDTE